MIRRPCMMAAAFASAALLGAGALPATASTAERAATYLLGAQNDDGGFGTRRGEKSDPMLTSWAALGLAAAGRNPRQRSVQGSSAIGYLRSRERFHDAGALARTLLVLHTAGLTSWFSGRDIYGDLMRHRRADGSFGGLVNLTAFGLLATSTSSDPRQAPGKQQSATWLAEHQNPDGGFSYIPGDKSGVDDTAAALQALVAAGMRDSPAAQKSVEYLLAAQQANGGFASAHTPSPNAANSMSTAWALQALIAAGLDPTQVVQDGRTPMHYLGSLQNSDGSIRYSRQRNHNPVWATAQALPALTGHAFPLDPVPLHAQPTSQDQSPTSGEEKRQSAVTRGGPRRQRATAQEHPLPALQGTGRHGVTAIAGRFQRKRATGAPAERADPPFSPPERISGRAQQDAGTASGGEIVTHPEGRPVEAALLAVTLVALTAAGWWWRGRRHHAPIDTGGAGESPLSGEEAGSRPPEDLDRELAILLRQARQESKEARPQARGDRTLEPH
jgi:hypothetical protein